MTNLPIYTVKERRPAHGELVLLFGIESAFEMGFIEPHWGQVEYSWLIVDRNGHDTGSQCLYEGPDDEKEFVPDEPGDRMRLMLLVDGYELSDEIKYATEADVYAMFPLEFLPVKP